MVDMIKKTYCNIELQVNRNLYSYKKIHNHTFSLLFYLMILKCGLYKLKMIETLSMALWLFLYHFITKI